MPGRRPHARSIERSTAPAAAAERPVALIALIVLVAAMASVGGCESVARLGRSQEPAPTSADETLVVMLGGDDDVASDHLRREHLAAIRSMAAELEVEVVERSVAEGAPEEVVLTPLLIYQNERGRSIYQGRYGNIDRVRNFVRTSRVVPREDVPLVRADVPVWSTGRATIATPIKITELTGERPDGFDEGPFRDEARAALVAGLIRFEDRDRVSLGRGDRMFYLDLHPYLGHGLLFIGCEVYSQFNCHEPVFSELADPIVGLWEERDDLFAEAGQLLETKVVQQIESSTIGDAFTPVDASAPVVSWSSIGLELPDATRRSRSSAPVALEMPLRWQVDAAAASEPAVLFRFPAPLDGYAGEARSLRGRLELEPDGLAGASGFFEVPVASLTMGDAALDGVIRGDQFLDAATWPTSRFELVSVETDHGTLRFGDQAQALLRGRFRMKGREIPLDVRATLEPIVDDAGRPRLLLRADWSIRLLDPFGLNGPDGPAPANDTLLFTCRISLEPVALQRHTEE